MALTFINQPEYRIDTPGFEHLAFTTSSKDYLTLPDAVTFARDRKSVLQSAAEAIAFRLDAKGADNANLYQTTRTVALYLKDGNTHVVAFDDHPEDNILLQRAAEGYAAHQARGTWLVPKRELSTALDRAAKAGRIISTPTENIISVATAARNGTSPYGSSPLVRAIIGDVAELYAHFLGDKGYGTAFQWLLTPTNLANIGVAGDLVEVRRVGVGGGDFDVNYLIAVVQCYGGGRARGVREISTGNKG